MCFRLGVILLFSNPSALSLLHPGQHGGLLARYLFVTICTPKDFLSPSATPYIKAAGSKNFVNLCSFVTNIFTLVNLSVSFLLYLQAFFGQYLRCNYKGKNYQSIFLILIIIILVFFYEIYIYFFFCNSCYKYVK